MKNYISLLFCIHSLVSFSQADYKEYYPLGDNANIRYMSSYRKEETILFEANPVVRYSFYNNFVKDLQDYDQKHMMAFYLSFRPQLRMYADNSKPVRTPSYRILAGTQHMIRFEDSNNYFAISLESGHYSNGQDRGAFSEEFADDSPEANAVYETITNRTDLSAILNRNSGNFSTNMTEVILSYRWFRYSDDTDRGDLPTGLISPRLGYTAYHNLFWGIFDFGGYTHQDIRLYGRHRFMAGLDVNVEILKLPLAFKQDFEWIDKPHASVQPFRSETTVTAYPFKSVKAFGVMAGYIYGHDNYNFRFVDSGHQVFAGISWTSAPLIEVRRKG